MSEPPLACAKSFLPPPPLPPKITPISLANFEASYSLIKSIVTPTATVTFPSFTEYKMIICLIDCFLCSSIKF